MRYPLNVSRMIEYRGTTWQLGPTSLTSDGDLLAYGVMLDNDGEPTTEGGFDVRHSTVRDL